MTVQGGTLRAVSVLLTTGAVVALTAQDAFTPARYRTGSLPPVPIQVVGGGEVFLEVTVSETGRVNRVTPLRVTPPFTDPLVALVEQWQFRPAEEEDPDSPLDPTPKRSVESKILVAELFRPPTLNAPTLGTLPVDAAPSSEAIPYPTATVTPRHPPQALFSGIVLIEVDITPAGTVAKATVVRSAPPFDAPAVDAAKRWTFRPARRDGRAAPVLAYIAFGFPQPVTAPRRR